MACVECAAMATSTPDHDLPLARQWADTTVDQQLDSGVNPARTNEMITLVGEGAIGGR